MADMPMPFSYVAYEGMLDLLAKEGYRFCTYHTWRGTEKPVILRHDIDFSLSRVLPMARAEANQGVRSTYFFLLRGDFYNVFSREASGVFRELTRLGHDIGLHFDETLYPDDCDFPSQIAREAAVLEIACGAPVGSVSMHRPSEKALAEDWKIPGLENAYSSEYFRAFKYVSDSRMHWREPVVDIIRSQEYDRLHILTHPFWYHEVPRNLPAILEDFSSNGEEERIKFLNCNFTCLKDELGASRVRRALVACMQGQSFEAERIVLRPLRMADVDDMYEYASDSETCKFLSWGPYKNRKVAEDWLSSKLGNAHPVDLLFGIELQGQRKLIGVVRVYNIDTPVGSAEVSYILNPIYQGKGYMTEAVQLAISLCFNTLGLSRVIAYCVEKNVNSSSLMQRVGMHRDVSYSSPLVIKGHEHRSIRYSISREQQQ